MFSWAWLMGSIIGLDNDLTPKRRPPIQLRIYTALGGDELIVQYFSKPGDTFLVLPGRRNATACPAWRRLGLPCAALPGQARRTQTHVLGRWRHLVARTGTVTALCITPSASILVDIAFFPVRKAMFLYKKWLFNVIKYNIEKIVYIMKLCFALSVKP